MVPDSALPAPTTMVSASAPRGRPSWSGLLQLSLVTVPVKAYPAVTSSPILSRVWKANGHVAMNYPVGWDVEFEAQCSILRDIILYPQRPLPTIAPSWLTWNDATIPKLAQVIYDDRRFEDMPILTDALMDAGCHDEDILSHCRSAGPHVKGCWLLDLLLGKT